MSEQKHTPGPWHLDRDGWIVSEMEDFAICLIDGSRSMSELDPLDAANARLIAAAPDMLEALRGILQQNEEFCQRTGLGDTDQMEAARAAISKALTP